MKKGIQVLIAFLLVSAYGNAQNINFGWAHKFGNVSNDKGTAIAADSSGNIIVAGTSFGKIDFDPGQDSLLLNGTGYFIAKYEPAGNILWAAAIGSVNEILFSGDITVDNAGSIYATGHFTGTVDFDPGPEKFELTKFGSYDVFVLKLDAGGKFQWVRRFGGPANDVAAGIAINGNFLCITGAFQQYMEFETGAAKEVLTATGKQDAFVLKLDTDGNYIWSKKLGGYGDDLGNAIAMDADGSVYPTGYYNANGDFDPAEEEEFTLFWGGGEDVFITKLDSNGQFVWAKRLGGKYSERPAGIALDPAGNIYTTGIFGVSGDFDPGDKDFNLQSNGGLDIFISKLSKDGYFIWAKNVGGALNESPRSIALDKTGGIYLTGGFQGNADFDPSSAEAVMTAVGSTADIFIVKLNTEGLFRWAKQIGAELDDFGNKITLDETGNIFITGSFRKSPNFNIFDDTFILTSDGEEDGFIMRLSQIVSDVKEGIEQSHTLESTIITNGFLQIRNLKESDSSLQIQIYSLEGNLLKEFVMEQQPKLHIDLSDQPQGTYLLKLTSGAESFMAKVNVVK